MANEFVTTVHLDKPSSEALSELRNKLGKKVKPPKIVSSSEVMRAALIKFNSITK